MSQVKIGDTVRFEDQNLLKVAMKYPQSESITCNDDIPTPLFPRF